MIVTDEYLDEILARYDRAREKSREDFFNKHFKESTMTDTLNTITVPVELPEGDYKTIDVKVNVEVTPEENKPVEAVDPVI